MQAADELFRAGLGHYAEVLFAAGHFESLIIEEIDKIFDQKREKLAQVFGIEKLQEGSVYRNRPNREHMQNMTLDTVWAWVGREYGIPNLSNCFLGLLISGGRPSVAIMFRRNSRSFRAALEAVLKPSGLYYYHDAGETVVSCSLEGCSSVNVLGTMLATLIDELTRALSEQAPFQLTVPNLRDSDAELLHDPT